jgi:LysM repeat protein
MQVARAFDMDWMEIAELNDLVSPYTLTPGQQLLLPGTGNAPSSNAAEAPADSVSEYSGTVYICQPGDYLYALARTFDVSWQALASYNGLTYPYIVYPGQEIRIP